MYGVTDEVAALFFDRAIATFALQLEAELHEVSQESKNRAQAKRKTALVLKRWLDSGESIDAVPMKFKDPAIRAVKSDE